MPPGGDRISRERMLMDIAFTVSQRSTCRRAKVGAVIAKGGRILATGYNGAPPGLPHCLDVGCSLTALGGCARATHAEANAITWAAAHGVPLAGADLFCTHEPCLACAQAILGARIHSVSFIHPYRLHEGLDLLAEASVLAQLFTDR